MMDANARKRIVFMVLNGMGYDASKVDKAVRETLAKMLGQTMKAHKGQKLNVFARVQLASVTVLADAKRLGL